MRWERWPGAGFTLGAAIDRWDRIGPGIFLNHFSILSTRIDIVAFDKNELD